MCVRSALVGYLLLLPPLLLHVSLEELSTYHRLHLGCLLLTEKLGKRHFPVTRSLAFHCSHSLGRTGEVVESLPAAAMISAQ